ncbi:MAG: hypothetical protein O7J95_20105, partial [Planctomycetota bacterium]|nr:hypothetical protein [Planctomycetota bacterium]
MIDPTRPPRIAPAFRRLERNVRRALASRGIADLFLFLGLTVLVSFLLDWTFELALLLRILVLAGCITLYVRVLLVGRRRVRGGIGPRTLLATVENYDPELDGQLMNAVEFRRELEEARREGREGLEVGLLRRAARESQEALRFVNIERALEWQPVWHRALLAALILVVVAGVARAFPDTFSVWAERNLLLSSVRWPRRTHYALERPEDVWHHARRAPLRINAWVV